MPRLQGKLDGRQAGEAPGEPAGASRRVPCSLWGYGTEVALKEQTKPVSHLQSLLKARLSAAWGFG